MDKSELAYRVLDALFEHKIYGLWGDIAAAWERDEYFHTCEYDRDILWRLNVLEDFDRLNGTWRIPRVNRGQV